LTTGYLATLIRRACATPLGLERILVAHGGPDRFPMAERIEAVPARELLSWRTLSDAL
jgi:hypothetical protein